MRLSRNILALAPCGKPQETYIAHVTALLQWLPERANFTGLEHCGGRSARTHARWFARPFPFVRLAVAALGAAHPRSLWELPIVDASFVPKSGRGTWGTGWFWSGMARAARWGLEVTLLAAVDVEEGGAYPLGARQSPGAVRSRRETAVDAALSLLREAVAAGARDILSAHWVAAAGGCSRRTFVEGVRALDLYPVSRLRRDSVLRFPYAGPHACRPGHRRQFDGRFNRRDLSRMSRTTPEGEQVDLYHAELHGKAWPCWLQVVYVLPRGADPQTTEGVLLYSTDLDLAPERIFRFYGALFQIEFAFRDAKQHLGLNDCQARAQAQLHFHFNIVFAALFWARLQARLQAERLLGPFSLRNLKRHNFEEDIHKRFAARSDTGRDDAKSGDVCSCIPPQRLWLPPPPLEMGPVGT